MAKNWWEESTLESAAPKNESADEWWSGAKLENAPQRTWGEAIKDTGAQLAEGVNTTLGAIPSVVAPQSKAAGFFRDNAQYWRDQQSDVLKDRIAASDQRIQEAGKDGVLSQIGTAASEYWNDPAQAARLVATNLPSMAATLGTGAAAGLAAKGVAAARGLDAANKAALAAKYGTTTAAATNAALNAGGARGEAFEDLQKTALAQGMTPEQAEQAGVSGSILPGVVGGVAGAVSGKIGLEKALLGQATTGAAMRKAGGAFGAELAGEQIEELAPKVATNYQVGQLDAARGLTDDLGRTMVETAIGSGPGAVVAGGAAGMRTGELPPVDLGPVDPTTSPGAADPNAPVPPGAAPVEAPEAPDLTTSPGAGVARDGIDFTREVDTSGLSLQDPAELERARAATVDYQPGDTTPQWETSMGAAAARQGLDMPAPEFDTDGLGLDPIRQMVKQAADAGGALSTAAGVALDLGATNAQFLGATGRDVQLRQTGPGVTNESNVIDVDAREVPDQRGIPTARRLTNEQEGGARATSSQPLAIPAPTNLREGLERIRAQRQEAARLAQVPPTQGANLVPQATQAVQTIAQQQEAGNQAPVGAAATTATQPGATGGRGVQADGVSNATPAESIGAQDTPASSPQGAAQAGQAAPVAPSAAPQQTPTWATMPTVERQQAAQAAGLNPVQTAKALKAGSIEEMPAAIADKLAPALPSAAGSQAQPAAGAANAEQTQQSQPNGLPQGARPETADRGMAQGMVRYVDGAGLPLSDWAEDEADALAQAIQRGRGAPAEKLLRDHFVAAARADTAMQGNDAAQMLRMAQEREALVKQLVDAGYTQAEIGANSLGLPLEEFNRLVKEGIYSRERGAPDSLFPKRSTSRKAAAGPGKNSKPNQPPAQQAPAVAATKILAPDMGAGALKFEYPSLVDNQQRKRIEEWFAAGGDPATKPAERGIYLPGMSVGKLERLIAKESPTAKDVESLKDYKYLLLAQKNDAAEKGFMTRVTADHGGFWLPKNKFWLTNIDQSIDRGNGSLRDAPSRPNQTLTPARQAPAATENVAEQAAPKPDSTVTTMRSLAQQFRDRHAVTKKDTDRTFAGVLDQFAQDVEQGKRTPQSVQQAIERYQELAAEPFQATQTATATHADPGQPAEAATPAVVAQSVQKAARNEEVKKGKRLAQAVAQQEQAPALVEKAPVATKTEANPLMETAKDSGKPEVADVKNASGYKLPEGEISDDWRDDKNRYREHPDFTPTPRQQRLMDEVKKVLDSGAVNNDDLQAKVADALGISDEIKASNRSNVRGGDFGYDVYYARKAVEAKAQESDAAKIRAELNLRPGDKLGTLIFNDFKQTNSVEVVSITEDGRRANFNGKRGAATVTFEATIPAVKFAIERAHEKGKRKDSYEEFIAGRSASPQEGIAAAQDKAQQAQAATDTVAQPITRADVEDAQQQAATLIGERIDAMTAGEVNTIAKKFLPTMGMKPTMSKANNKAAMTDPKINLEAAAAEVGATLPAEVTRALQADMEGRVVDVAQDEGVTKAMGQAQTESQAPAEPNPLEHTPKQYADAWLRWVAESNGLPLAEVREMQGDEAGLKAIEQRWVDAVVQEAKSGQPLPTKTLDKLLEVRPNTQLPESAIPDGYQRQEARKQEAEEKQARADNRKKVKQGAADNPFADYNALAQQYGYEVRPDGAIGSDGKFPGPTMKVKGGRLRIESGSGDLLASYAGTSPDSLGKFLESFWYAEKKADGATEAQGPRPMFSRAPAAFSFAGQQAVTADQHARTTAQQRLDAGEDAEAVRQDTGWFKGTDGKWRFEINDADAKLRPALKSLDGGGYDAKQIASVTYRKREDGTYDVTLNPPSPKQTSDFVTLTGISKGAMRAVLPDSVVASVDRNEGDDDLIGDFEEAKRINVPFEFGGFNALPLDNVIDHPALFAAYPALRDVMVQVDPKLGIGGSFSYVDHNDGTTSKVIRLGSARQLSTLLHEIQHGIQNIEGFASGGSPNEFRDESADAEMLRDGAILAVMMRSQGTIEKAKALFVQRFKREPAFGSESAALSGESPESMRARADNALAPQERYRRLAGEVEARNTQARQSMTDEQRRATPPSQTADVADSRVIVMFNGKEMANAPMPANAAPDAATTAQPLRTPAATIRAAITKAYGKLLGQLESKGLVTLTQTQEQAIEAAAQARADKTGQPLEEVRASLMASVSNSGAFDTKDLDIKRSANGAIQGFFDPQTGQSFLIADNLTAEAAPGVLMHEVGIHMAADGSMKALFNRAATMLKLQRGNPFIKAVQARMDSAGETSGEEAAAYIAEAYENDRANAPASVQRWLADLLAAVKAWMFKKGIMGADRLTVADIAAVARANARSMARDGGATGGQGFGPAFSREASDAPVDFSSDPRFHELFYGEPTQQQVAEFQRWLDANPETIVRLYHGTAAVNPVEAKGLLKTTASRRNSMQSTSGYVYLSVYPGMADSFARMAAQNRVAGPQGKKHARYAVDMRVAELLPDTDQLRNQRMFADRKVGNTLAESLVYGHAARVKGNVASERISLDGPMFSRTPGDQTQTEAFKRWFAGSKVVDADGKPLVMYHGTSGNEGGDAFTYFDAYASNYGLMGQGAYFTDNPEVASSYTTKGKGETPTVYKVFLSIQNPIDMDAKADPAKWQKQFDGIEDFHEGGETNESWYRAAEDLLRDQGLPMWEGAETMQDGLRAMGFDGITHIGGGRVKSDGVRHRVYIAFEPTQIKSATGNRGTFDPADPDIRFSRATATGAPVSAWDAPVQTGFDDVIYKLQDKHIDLKRVIESITKSVGAIADNVNAYLKEELFHKRAAKRVEDFGAKELKPLLNQMRLAGLSMEDVEEYLHARHAKEANAVIAERNPDNPGLQDGGSGMTNQAADNYFAKLDPTQRRKLEAAAKSVDAIIEGTRKLYVSYGLEDQAVVDGWANMYQHYIPLMREDKEGGMGIGQGFSVKGKETKGRTGSTRKVVDILANIAAQREKVIVRGEKNRVTQALVGLAQANPNPEFWEVRSQAPTERVFDPKSGVVVERPDPLFKSRDNVVVAKVKDANGNVTEQMVVFNEDNPRAVRMAAAMKNLDAGNLEGLLGMSAKITRYFSAINTQYNPVFGVVNLVRDVQGAMVNLAATPLAGQQGKIARDTVSALAGIYSDIRKTRKGGQATSQWAQLWEQMQDDGGTTGYRELFTNSADRANNLKSILNPEGWMDSKWGKFFTAGGKLKVPMSVAQKGASEIFGWLSDYNEAMENGVRLAAYKAALDKGMSREQAASLAKNLTVNFNRKGQAGMQAGAVYAFFNAAMQGTARIGQTLFDMDGGDISTLRLSKTGKAVVYGGVTLGVMQALALSAAGFDDDDPPEFVRERSLIIPTGGKTYVSIPMPLGLHVIPGIGRHATEFALSGFDKPAKRALSVIGMFADAFNPIGNAGLSMQTLAPTALDPLVALTENKDWTGKPIARVSSNKALPGHTQWKDSATGISKVVAEAINWVSGGNEYVAGAFSPTPDQIDYLLAQVGGGVAREAAKVQQTITTALSGETLPTHKIPLVGRFVGNAASQASQGSAFYANLNKLNELETEIKGLRKDGRFDEAAKLARENPQSMMIAMANRAERDVQRLRREKRELIAKDASREEVRAKEEQITAVMTRLNEAAARRLAPA